MNRPSRTDEPQKGDGYNQSPNQFANDLTTNEDLNGISNTRVLRRERPLKTENSGQDPEQGGDLFADGDPLGGQGGGSGGGGGGGGGVGSGCIGGETGLPHSVSDPAFNAVNGRIEEVVQSPAIGCHLSDKDVVDDCCEGSKRSGWSKVKHALFTFGKFVGPGFMVAVAYIDPGNYATDVAAGASYQYRLLFIVLLSNLFAIFLQSLSIKLGTVSGLNLAEACRAFLPKWVNIGLYLLAEGAIIATDLAEVVGTAIALNLLIPQLPLVAGCALSILDVMIILIFYQPKGSMRGLRAFEFFVVALVLVVVICFCIQLSLIKGTPAIDIVRGYLPSSILIEQQALYQACGILGATVMPHSLYLGSGIVQSRLREYDSQRGLLPPEIADSSAASTDETSSSSDRSNKTYIPSLRAIRHSLKYSIAELTVSLFTFALFVNSAILVVAGASLYGNQAAQTADIFGIHDLLSSSIAPAAGTVFALALLLSGVSAGIVCTIAGQMVSEGALRWTVKPWQRRLVTRSISITPSIIVAGAVGRPGLDAALNGSQVALSIALPFVTAPLIYFTCRRKYMTVQPGMARFEVQGGSSNGCGGGGDDEEKVGRRRTRARSPSRCCGGSEEGAGGVLRWCCRFWGWGKARPDENGVVNMANSWPVAVLGVLIWLVVTAMNVANLVLLGRGSG